MLLGNRFMIFFHAGKPIAQQRPRFANGIVYDPQSKEKTRMKFEFANQFRSQGCLNALEGPIAAKVDILCPIPASWSKKHKESVLSGVANYVTSRPDLDNYIKFVFDVLNKIAYNDDSQIVSLSSKKIYSKTPGVTIEISKIEENIAPDEDDHV